MLFDETVFCQLFFDLAEIAFGPGDIQGVGDGFQMLDFGFRICQLFCKRLFCTLQFSVTVKIFFCVFGRGERGIQGNGDFLVCIVIQSLKRFGPFFQPVSVGVDQLSVYFVFILFGGVFKLLLLKNIFFAVAFQRRLYDPPEIGGFLPDPVESIPGGIVGIQHCGHSGKFYRMVFASILCKREYGIFHRFLAAVNDIRRKIPFLHLIHQTPESMVKMDAGGLVQRLGRVVSVDRSAVTDLFCDQRA